MDKNTLCIVENIDFNQIMLKLLTPNSADGLFLNQVVSKTIIIIALATGLPLRDLIQWDWGDVFEINSKGKIRCRDSFKSDRNYKFHINLKIQKQLIRFYTLLNQPNFGNKIVNSLKKPMSFDEWLLVTNIQLGMRTNKAIESHVWEDYRNEHLTQILFGRRVFEICCYTNSNCKVLKGLYKIKTNDELFSFLGYDSKSDIKYNLRSISTIEGINKRYTLGEPKSFLDDNKHFLVEIDKSNNYYPFQHFQVFHDFLQSLKLNKYDAKTQGVLILIMLSLTNGIRPSALLELKWTDVFISEKNGVFNSFVIRREFKFGRYQIVIEDNTMAKILIHYKLLFGDGQQSVKRDSDRLTFLRDAPRLEGSCFVTNRLNPLTQPSLLREIKNSLSMAGFQHTEKFTTKSAMIMYGRRIIELKGNHPPTIKALKTHFNIRKTASLFEFLYINENRGNKNSTIEGFNSVFDHILYDI